MPKLTNVTDRAQPKAFIDNHLITIRTHRMGNKITGFEATYKGETKVFKVDSKKWDIEEQFKKLEKFIS